MQHGPAGRSSAAAAGRLARVKRPVGVLVVLLSMGGVLVLALWPDEPKRTLDPAPPPSRSAARKPWETPDVAVPAPQLDPANTALWIRRQWLHTQTEDAEIEGLAKALKASKVTRVYPFLGGINEEGMPGWRSLGVHQRWNEAKAKSFLERFAAQKSGVQVLPWTGGVNGRELKFGDEKQMAAFVAEAQRVVELGADGVHLNIEPVKSGDPGLLALLKTLREKLPARATLSVAAVAPMSPRIAMRPEYYWSFEYLREVCRAADEVVVMGYDTWLGDEASYRLVVREWTQMLVEQLPAADCTWRMGVPSYDDAIPHHDLDVERLDVALRGVREGLAEAGKAGGFSGVAIYASWTTDDQEWAAYDRLWLGRESGSGVLTEPAR
jgi:Glycosyl hydrolases family 18